MVARLLGQRARRGQRHLYPTNATCTTNSAAGSCRANIEWRTNAYGPPGGGAILRRTLFSVFAHAGEVIETGSSAVGVGAGDILICNPGVVTDQQAATLPAVTPGTNGFTCSHQRTVSGIAAQGQLTTRAQELAGPQAVNGGGNLDRLRAVQLHRAGRPASTPSRCTGPTVTAQADGRHRRRRHQLTGRHDFSTRRAPASPPGTSPSAPTPTSTTDITGRLFTYALAAFTGGNGLPLNQRVYVTTTDGFRYQTDTNGLDPNGFLMYGNRAGFLDADGVTPLDHDALGTTNTGQLTARRRRRDVRAPRSTRLSFTPLSHETLAALEHPDHPDRAGHDQPVLQPAASPATTPLVGAGGTFSYTENVPAQYEFVISRDGTNFDPGNPVNRVLRGERAGRHQHGGLGRQGQRRPQLPGGHQLPGTGPAAQR